MTLWQIWFFPFLLHEIVAVKRFYFNPLSKKISAQIAVGCAKGAGLVPKAKTAQYCVCVFGRLYYHSQVCTPCPWTLYFHLCHSCGKTCTGHPLTYPSLGVLQLTCMEITSCPGRNFQQCEELLPAPAPAPCSTATWTSSTSLSSPSSNEE